jgi:hypothetical protein
VIKKVDEVEVAMQQTIVKASDIFIAGGEPNVTYNPRKDLLLEEQLDEYLDTGYKLLSITGPTKSGKTVLSRKIIPQIKGIWVPGGQVDNENDFWSIINDKLMVYTQYSSEDSEETAETSSERVDGGLNFGVAKAGVIVTDSGTDKTGKKISKVHQRNPRIGAIEALMKSKLPLVIDDFHYIDKEVQTSVVRALKDPIFEGLRVIVIAVPHRAYDAVKVENEMTGRVSQLTIPIWEESELREISQKGFPELNVICPEEITKKFAKESYGSPHLMQEFCLKLCYSNQIKEASNVPLTINEPGDYELFFRKIVATSASKTAFERLARGPRQRTDRVKRNFVDGTEGDIYLAILKALSQTGPKVRISYEELREGLRKVIEGNIPQAHEVTRVLTKMSEIAKDDIPGEPVIDWVKDDSTLFISDPFFAFYLRWS